MIGVVVVTVELVAVMVVEIMVEGVVEIVSVVTVVVELLGSCHGQEFRRLFLTNCMSAS